MKRDPWLWEEEDLLELIASAAQESVELDYKQCGALEKTEKKKKEISKDVSALANAAGGTIVYGMVEDGHFPTGIDEGFDPSETTKEWLEQVINSNIQRRLSGVRVKQVFLNQTNPGRVAYVVHVPQSAQAPHQAADKKFYKRFNFESVPMEEYEIRDVANRETAPDIDFRLTFGQADREIALVPVGEDYFAPIEIRASVSNRSESVASHAVFHIDIDGRIAINDYPDTVHESWPTDPIKYDEVVIELNRLTMYWGRRQDIPLYAGIIAEMPESGIEIAIPREETIFIFRCVISAPRMKPRGSLTVLSVEDGVAKLMEPDEYARVIGLAPEGDGREN